MYKRQSLFSLNEDHVKTPAFLAASPHNSVFSHVHIYPTILGQITTVHNPHQLAKHGTGGSISVIQRDIDVEHPTSRRTTMILGGISSRKTGRKIITVKEHAKYP